MSREEEEGERGARPVPKVAAARHADGRDSGARARGRVVPAGLGDARSPRGSGLAGGPRPVHSPSLDFFFLASVPPNLPRKDSSFFILGGRRGDERSCGAEDMGRGGHRRPGAGAALGGAAWWPPRRPIAPGSGRRARPQR